MSPTRAMRDTLVAILEEKRTGFTTYDTLQDCYAAGYLGDVTGHGDHALTETGRVVALAHQEALEQMRAKRNRANRIRSSILRDCGMTRTRSGSWE